MSAKLSVCQNGFFLVLPYRYNRCADPRSIIITSLSFGLKKDFYFSPLFFKVIVQNSGWIGSFLTQKFPKFEWEKLHSSIFFFSKGGPARAHSGPEPEICGPGNYWGPGRAWVGPRLGSESNLRKDWRSLYFFGIEVRYFSIIYIQAEVNRESLK